ncbi:MAG: hypothetical protein ACW98W_20385 [Candidatus Hodarchaeales archaeon]|jgi:hypothetical protein
MNEWLIVAFLVGFIAGSIVMAIHADRHMQRWKELCKDWQRRYENK